VAIILKANEVNLFVSSALFVFWYNSPKNLDTPRMNRDTEVFQHLPQSFPAPNITKPGPALFLTADQKIG
jgi:hypothetical protein